MMDLISKTAIAVIAVIAVLAMVYLVEYFLVMPPAPFTESQAEALIIKDLTQHSPDVNATILNASPSAAYPGSWNVFVRLVYGQNNACPSMSTESFIYPATGFLNTTVIYSNYSNGTCRLYISLANASRGVSRIIGLSPLAIDVPYNDSVPEVVGMIDKYGYSDVVATAHLYSTLEVAGKNVSDVWLVSYTAPQHNSTYAVVLNQSGGIIYMGTTI